MAPKLKLTYFNIEGAAEKVRLSLKIGGLEFEDVRIDFPSWPALKPTTPYGQLPMLSIDDGPPMTQSGAMLRYVGKLTGQYPQDPIKALAVDEVIGLLDDFQRAVTPSMVIARNPQSLGYAADMPEADRKAIQAKMRAELVKEGGDIPKYLGYFEEILKKNGTGYFCGDSVTIADCSLLATFRMLKGGFMDGVPPTITDAYPHITSFVEKLSALPALKAYYAK